MRSRRLLLLLPTLLLAGCVTTVSGSATPAGSSWSFVGEQPCADAGALGADEFSCITLSVPVDHADPTGEHWDVTFGLLRATGESHGVFVTATGGPGSSGLAAADDYLSYRFPARLREQYDVVFFDQRGIGLSQEFRCDDTYYDTFAETVDSSSSAADRDAYATAATRFGRDCFAEAGVDPATAPRYATRQAVEDLEAFRQWLAAPSLVLYGESYGTQYVQTYAAAHPTRVARMVVDGVVDLTTPIADYATESARADNGVLATTLAFCDTEPACADAAPGDSSTGFDELRARLAADPVTLPDDTTVDDTTLLGAAYGSIRDPSSRRQLQVAVNDALDGDYDTLVELASGSSTGPTPDFSDGLFYAVDCTDYEFVPQGGDPRAALDGWLDRAGTEGVDGLRLGGSYYGDTPCLFWPGAADTADLAPPAPVTDPPYPVLVVNADTDVNTPFAGARGVFKDLTPGAGPEDALVVLRGGGHVLWGTLGDSCVDDPVDDFLVDGTLPADRVTLCPGQVADPY